MHAFFEELILTRRSTFLGVFVKNTFIMFGLTMFALALGEFNGRNVVRAVGEQDKKVVEQTIRIDDVKQQMAEGKVPLEIKLVLDVSELNKSKEKKEAFLSGFVEFGSKLTFAHLLEFLIFLRVFNNYFLASVHNGIFSVCSQGITYVVGSIINILATLEKEYLAVIIDIVTEVLKKLPVLGTAFSWLEYLPYIGPALASTGANGIAALFLLFYMYKGGTILTSGGSFFGSFASILAKGGCGLVDGAYAGGNYLYGKAHPGKKAEEKAVKAVVPA